MKSKLKKARQKHKRYLKILEISNISPSLELLENLNEEMWNCISDPKKRQIVKDCDFI